MGGRPLWRLPVRAAKPQTEQSEAFKAARKLQFPPPPERQCVAIARGSGERCKQPALKGATRCKAHNGHYAAAKAEAERLGRPIVVVRPHRKRALAALGATMPWPDGVPKRDDLLELGPVARGRLFEAWLNRELDPGAWKHELERERKRRPQQPRKTP